MTTPAAIEIVGLTKAYGDHAVLEGVDLVVRAGTIHALLGSNGAGKTTVVKVLSTLLRPDGGSAAVAGHDVVTAAALVRESISLTGQFAAVDEVLTGRENLVLIAQLRRLDDPGGAADALLSRFDLTGVAGQRALTYSGGLRRRLDIAMSLIGDPPVLFLDEPTTGLDPQSRLEVWKTVRELADRGTTVLLTTQYLDEADQLADRIAVIDTGRVVAEGTSDDLKALVGTSALQLTLADTADADAASALVARVTGSTPTLSPESRRINAPLADTALVTDVLVALRERGIEVTEMSLQKPSLDEVFLSITGHTAESVSESENEEAAA